MECDERHSNQAPEASREQQRAECHPNRASCAMLGEATQLYSDRERHREENEQHYRPLD